MTALELYFLISFMVFIIFFVPVLYVLYKISRPPLENPKAYLKRMHKQERLYRENLTLIGDSITHGNSSANYVKIIQERIKEKGLKYDVINAGINGNTTTDILARIDTIIKCKPNFATILIGTNDAKNSFNNGIKIKNDAKRIQKLEEDLNIYRKNLISIIERLKKDTNAKIALISIPPIGEDFDDPAFKLSLRYANVIKNVVNKQNLVYLPLQEKIIHWLKRNPHTPTYPYKRWFVMMFWAILTRHLFKKSFQEIGEGKGFGLHSDYLHMNEKGASMIAKEVILFLLKS